MLLRGTLICPHTARNEGTDQLITQGLGVNN